MRPRSCSIRFAFARHETKRPVGAYQFVLDGPLEASSNAANRLVDCTTGPAAIDHALADCLQREGAKFTGNGSTIQFPNQLQRVLDDAVFTGEPTVFTVVALCVFAVGIEDFDDGSVDTALQLSAVRKELSNQTIILSSAGLSVPFA